MRQGGFAFNRANAHILGLLRNAPFQQETSTVTDDYESWINAVWGSHSERVITSALCKESNPSELRAAEHTDKGLLPIYSNLADMELLMNGQWVALESGCDVAIALCGIALERATCGLFRPAVPHRIRNSGRCLSRVMKLRLCPSLVIDASSILAAKRQAITS